MDEIMITEEPCYIYFLLYIVYVTCKVDTSPFTCIMYGFLEILGEKIIDQKHPFLVMHLTCIGLLFSQCETDLVEKYAFIPNIPLVKY